MALRLTIAPTPLECGCHRVQVAAKTVCEAMELRNPTAFGGSEPFVERRMVVLSDEPTERECQALHRLEYWPLTPELLEEQEFVR